MLEKWKFMCYNKNGCRIKEITENRERQLSERGKIRAELTNQKMKTRDGR